MNQQLRQGGVFLKIVCSLIFLGALFIIPIEKHAMSQTDCERVSVAKTVCMQIQGKISVKGSEPHTYLCLSTDSGIDYRLTGTLRAVIWTRYQQLTVTLEGMITKAELGPGFPAEFE
ncbi:MAG: hypothetical protein ABIK68_14215, partial [bacterium]